MNARGTRKTLVLAAAWACGAGASSFPSLGYAEPAPPVTVPEEAHAADADTDAQPGPTTEDRVFDA